MIINVRFDDSESNKFNSKEYDLDGDELRSILLCDGVGHDGSYFKIINKFFEDTKDGYSMTVIAKKDFNVTT